MKKADDDAPQTTDGDSPTVDHAPPSPAAETLQPGPVDAAQALTRTGDFVPGAMADAGETKDHLSPSSPSTPPEDGATADYQPAAEPAASKKRAVKGPKELPRVSGYEILGELGRGGMGVVYKVRDQELDRLVALKMVLAGGHAGPEQLARFHTEAQAVARMQHPNIVQIYQVGHQHDLPFFSLEFVDGGSLDKKLDRTPQPPLEAAQLVETLARAMHVAHERGIVHRDLKPANVLLAKDGTPKITDFGLAKRLEGEDSGQTRSGTVMGTPSYMAPEQARGDIQTIGPLSDVYALGAILYEVLTGRPPFKGATMWDTIDQVLKQEPVPPSQLQPKLPRDLETMCLKCLQKDQHKRYDSAMSLAEDLRRFQAGEPILARPVSAPERLWRWCRRNQRVAVLMGTVGGLLVICAVGGVSLAWWALSERDLKEEQRVKAEANADRATKGWAKADENAKIAKTNEEKALTNEKTAIKNLEIATKQNGLHLAALQKFIGIVQTQLGNRPGMSDLQFALLDIAGNGLKEVARELEKNPTQSIDKERAKTNKQLGDLFKILAQPQEALKQYEQCQKILAAIAEQEPGELKHQLNLASVANLQADMLLQLGDTAKAHDRYQQALNIRLDWRSKATKNGPAYLAVSNSYGLLGKVAQRKGQPAAARNYYLDSLKYRQQGVKLIKENPDEQREHASLYDRLAETSFKLGDGQAALDYFSKALEWRKILLDQAPPNQNIQQRRDLALSNVGLGDVHWLLLKDPRQAQTHYLQAEGTFRLLYQVDEKNMVAWRDLGSILYRLGAVSLALQDEQGSQKYYQECLTFRRQVAAADKGNLDGQVQLMLVLPHCGEYREAAKMANTLFTPELQDAGRLYHLACGFALCSAAAADTAEKDAFTGKALAALRRAIDQGWEDVLYLEADPDLEGVRGRPEFAKLVEQLKTKRQGSSAP